jgi:hypothetical protein
LKPSFVIGLIFLQTCCTELIGHCVDESAQFVSVKEMKASCGIPGPCNVAMGCETKTVRVRGYIDHDNVFDKEHYPQLPYEKFTIRDRSGKSIEVWIVTENSRDIFREINRHKSSPETMAYVEGEVVGVDMPIMGMCHRGIKINLTAAKRLSFR